MNALVILARVLGMQDGRLSLQADAYVIALAPLLKTADSAHGPCLRL